MRFRKSSFFFCSLCVVLICAGCSTRPSFIRSPSSPQAVPTPSGPINNSPAMHRATMRPYTINGKSYAPTQVSVGDYFSGVASWYGKDFHGKKTSNGETYNMYDMTAAHKTFPMNTMLKVTNLKNQKSVVVRINDRGPFVGTRIIDLSYTAATRLDLVGKGTGPVSLEVMGFAGVIAPAGKAKESVTVSDYCVQIGAFRNPQGAKRYQSAHQLVEGRYKALLKEGELEGSPIYRIWLSGFQSEAEAADFIDQGHFKGAFVVKE